jgi:excisionase family DNA binding protein
MKQIVPEKLVNDLMTVEECSEYLGLPISRLRKMCHYKQIPFCKLGRRVRFYKPDIVRWVLSKKAA